MTDPSPQTSPAVPEEAAAVPEEDLTAAAEEVAEQRSADDLHAALQEAERLRDEYLDQAQRGRAEYLNLKRRSDEALAAAQDRGAERLLGRLLGVLDNFGYVVGALDDVEDAPAAGDESLVKLAQGVRMVHRELLGVLESSGMEPVPGAGSPFDPQVHEALLSEEAAEAVEEPVVTEVLRPGYRFKGRTLRPASVKVAR